MVIAAVAALYDARTGPFDGSNGRVIPIPLVHKSSPSGDGDDGAEIRQSCRKGIFGVTTAPHLLLTHERHCPHAAQRGSKQQC